MTTTQTAEAPRPMLTIKDIQTRLRCSRNTAYARTRDETFPLPYVFGGTYRWDFDEVDSWVDAQRATTRDITPQDRTTRPSERTKKTVIKEAPLPTPRPVAKRVQAGEAA